MITANNVVEREPHYYEAEASTLGLPPGVWPKTIPCNIGNKQPLVRTSRNNGEDVLYVNYVQQFGCVKIRIFND